LTVSSVIIAQPCQPFQDLFDVGVRHAGSADRDGGAVLAPLDR
jgi:hypothetical protein